MVEQNKQTNTRPQMQGRSQGRRSFGGDRDNKRGGKFGGKGRGSRRGKREQQDFETKMLDLARVTRVTKGGKRFSFRATVVIGDSKGMTGVGVSQGRDVQQAMQKATSRARRDSIKVKIINGTIPHEVSSHYHGAVVLIKPAASGSGVKAGGPVRVVARLAGIEDVTAKLIERTSNKTNIARATINALKQLRMKPSKQVKKQENADTSDTKK